MHFLLQCWLLVLLALGLQESCPASACTVFELYTSGLASSFWHMIPAVALFADNGTFYVSKSRHLSAYLLSSYLTTPAICSDTNYESILAGGQQGLSLCARLPPASLTSLLLSHCRTSDRSQAVQTDAPRMEVCTIGLVAT